VTPSRPPRRFTRRLNTPALGGRTRPKGRRRFVCGDQSGRISAPMSPRLVQTMRGRNEHTTVSSGSQWALNLAL
jgi:hypothetical protein